MILIRKKKFIMKFTKMQGAGNDYIYINCFEEKVDSPEMLSERLSDRHFGIGGDGIVLIMPSDKADFRMRMFNADGSEGKMCGNASRCIGKYVYDNKLTDKKTVTLETLSGIKTLTLFTNENNTVDHVCVDMGKAVLKPADIPMTADGDDFIDRPITVDGKTVNATAVSMGNPHCVIFTENIDSLDLEKIGPAYENQAIFPQKVNTEFVEILGKNTLKMRVWERGSGETLACGTGACAVAAAACLNGICDRDSDITIKLRGGELVIKYMSDGTVFMTGNAVKVFDGKITV